MKPLKGIGDAFRLFRLNGETVAKARSGKGHKDGGQPEAAKGL